MLLRLVLFVVFAIIVARAFWRLVDGVVEGIKGGPARGGGRVPTRGVQMVRDPVCGTFVLPDHALTLVDGRARLFFCSDACRAKYRATSRDERAEGRTA
jgi:hypothetical protein